MSEATRPCDPGVSGLYRTAKRLAGCSRSGLCPTRSTDVVVLGIPRGGLPVAREVAHALGAPLDVIVVRKLGAPGQPELGIGAVVDGDHPRAIFNQDIIEHLGVSDEYIEAEIARQLKEVTPARNRLSWRPRQDSARRQNRDCGRRRHRNRFLSPGGVARRAPSKTQSG